MSDYEEFNLDAFAKPKPRAVDTLEQQEHFIFPFARKPRNL